MAKPFTERNRLEKARDYVVYLCVRVLICVVQAVPMRTCEAFAWNASRFISRWLPIRRKVMDENLNIAFPDLSDRERTRIRRGMWYHLLLMVCEIAHAARVLHRNNWRQHVRLSDEQGFVHHLLSDRPILLVSAHFGNFELAGFLCGLFGFPSYTIARPLDNYYLHRYVNDFRALTGQFILPKQGSATQVQEILDRGGTLGLLGDQHAGAKGLWLPFFNKRASSHKAIALFSLTNDAPMLVSFATRQDNPLEFCIDMRGVFDPADSEDDQQNVRWLTSWYNRLLEEAVVDAPDQYWWVHRRWKS